MSDPGPMGPQVSKLTFSKNSFRISIRVSNSLDPDQHRRFFSPDLGSNCLQKLTVDNKGRDLIQGLHRLEKYLNLHFYCAILKSP